MAPERRTATAAETIEHLVGMQAQVPSSPYIGLWSRLDGFATEELSGLIRGRRPCGPPSCARRSTCSRHATS